MDNKKFEKLVRQYVDSNIPFESDEISQKNTHTIKKIIELLDGMSAYDAVRILKITKMIVKDNSVVSTEYRGNCDLGGNSFDGI